MLRPAIRTASPCIHARLYRNGIRQPARDAYGGIFLREPYPQSPVLRAPDAEIRQTQVPPLPTQKSDIQTPLFRWTGSLVELVEIIYALDETGCINDGQNDIKDLAAFFGSLFGMEIKVRNCYDAYLDMKRRKNESRTYFLDKLRERLNLRMQRDDAREMTRR